ncbi:MAG TPA: FlgD immunoglobulin-like domain containing protein [bacterium]|nr:FlgD immunoglobulin-like domain containing protein [bacterium]
MTRLHVLLFFFAGLAAWLPAQDMTIDSHGVPSVIGTYGRFRQNSSAFTWTAFDSTRTHWDLTSYPGGEWSRVGIVDWTTGSPPAPETTQADAPDPQVMEVDTLGSGSVQDIYEYRDSSALYIDGIDFQQGGYRFLGNFRPDAAVYATPLRSGSSWASSINWQCEITPGIPYTATETHTKSVVARGKVKVPMSGDYYWPCLVVRDHMTFTDNLGSNDARWIYEWLVPGHFSGANGVAAAMSPSNDNPNFTTVAAMMQLSSASIPNWDLLPPEFSNARVWPDTTFAGPYVVWTVIRDNDSVAEESLFYRVDSGAWVGSQRDSARADTFYFTIPSVTHSSRIDYYFWARDRFSTDNDIDFWTTWPVCSPESTMVTFHVDFTGAAEQEPAIPGRIGLSAAPNPFGGSTTFYFNYPNTRQATIKVFSSSGELVRNLEMSPVPTLGFQAHWDGRDESGQPVPDGTYLYRVESGGYIETRKVTLTR